MYATPHHTMQCNTILPPSAGTIPTPLLTALTGTRHRPPPREACCSLWPPSRQRNASQCHGWASPEAALNPSHAVLLARPSKPHTWQSNLSTWKNAGADRAGSYGKAFPGRCHHRAPSAGLRTGKAPSHSSEILLPDGLPRGWWEDGGCGFPGL